MDVNNDKLILFEGIVKHFVCFLNESQTGRLIILSCVYSLYEAIMSSNGGKQVVRNNFHWNE